MVVVLGIAILGMTGIIIVKGIEKFGSADEPVAGPAQTPAPVVTPVQGEAWQANVGSGRIVSAEMDAGHLMLLIEDTDGRRRVEIRDIATGAVRGQATTE